MPKKMKYTYHKNGTIPYPTAGWVFVFGSNLAGLHRLGAAKLAAEMFGAEMYLGAGIMGRSYAIPTKNRFIQTLTISEIKKFVNQFIDYTNSHPEINFWVTAVGCGLAKYKHYQIAPLFVGAGTNCSFPVEWRPFLQ